MTTLLLFIAFAIVIRFVLLLSSTLLSFNGTGPGSSGNTHGFSYTKSYDFWPLLSRAMNFKNSAKHPFSINSKKMQVIAKKNLCLRNSTRTDWSEAVNVTPYQIPFFTLTSDFKVVRHVQEGPSAKDVNSGRFLGLKIADYLRLQGRSVEKSFDELCEDIRNRQILRHINCSNYDLLLNQYSWTPTIDDFCHYPGGGRVNTSFSSENLVFRATLTKRDYTFIDEQSEQLTADLSSTASFRLHQPQRVPVCVHAGSNAFFNSAARDTMAFKERIQLHLATEIIWAKLANFINSPKFTEDYQPHVDHPESPAAFTEADSADLSTSDYAKLANYAPKSNWFSQLKSDIYSGRTPGGSSLPRKFR